MPEWRAQGWRVDTGAARDGIRPQPFYLGVVFVAVGLALSALLGTLPPDGAPAPREVFWRTTMLDRNLSSVSQAGLVNNLNGMAWGSSRWCSPRLE